MSQVDLNSSNLCGASMYGYKSVREEKMKVTSFKIDSLQVADVYRTGDHEI